MHTLPYAGPDAGMTSSRACWKSGRAGKFARNPNSIRQLINATFIKEGSLCMSSLDHVVPRSSTPYDEKTVAVWEQSADLVWCNITIRL